MEAILEAYKFWKAERTDTARKVKALSGKVSRYLAQEIILPDDVTHSSLLLDMDELWRRYQSEHAELGATLTQMEAVQPGSFNKYHTVNLKNMAEYFTDGKEHAVSAQGGLKTAIALVI